MHLLPRKVLLSKQLPGSDNKTAPSLLPFSALLHVSAVAYMHILNCHIPNVVSLPVSVHNLSLIDTDTSTPNHQIHQYIHILPPVEPLEIPFILLIKIDLEFGAQARPQTVYTAVLIEEEEGEGPEELRLCVRLWVRLGRIE